MHIDQAVQTKKVEVGNHTAGEALLVVLVKRID